MEGRPSLVTPSGGPRPDLVVAGQRLQALCGMVDDRGRVAGHVDRFVYVGSREVRKLGDPAAYVGAVGVEPAALAGRVEDPEVRRGVGAGPGHPLPVVLVGGEVPVGEPVHEVPGAVPPPHVQVLDQEAGHDHPDPVVHPAGGAQLAHPGVDDGEPGAALRPRRRTAGRGRRSASPATRDAGRGGRSRAGGAARRRRTPARRAPCGRWRRPSTAGRPGRPASCAGGSRPSAGRWTSRWRRRGQDGPGRRRSRRSGRSRKSAQAVRAAPSPAVGRASPSGRSTCGTSSPGEGVPARPRRRPGGPPPAVVGPGLLEGRVDLVRRAVRLQHPARRDGVRRPQPLERHAARSARRLLDPFVALAAVGAEVGGDVHGGRAGLCDHCRDDLDGVARPHHQPAVQRLVEGSQRGGQVAPPGRAGAAPQQRVEDEERHRRAGGQGGQQCRVVVQAQVAAEPHHGGSGRRTSGTAPPCHLGATRADQ